MSDDINTEAVTTKPLTYAAYQVRNRPANKAVWTRIGTAVAHKDGQGFNVLLNAAPLDGRITLRLPMEIPAQPET